eukprot:gene29788-51827_t
MTPAITPAQTPQALPYPALASEIEALLRDPTVVVPARTVQPLAGGGSLFVMPAVDARVAITKLITFIPDNATRGLPAIQGDIIQCFPNKSPTMGNTSGADSTMPINTGRKSSDTPIQRRSAASSMASIERG